MDQQEIINFLRQAVQLTEAVSELHRQGQVHGNITPSSIITYSGSSAISGLDFPEAENKILTTPDHPSRNQGLVHLAYMAPEQTGKTGYEVDFRTDLYSLGAVFYEMLSGCPPFSCKDPVELASHHLSSRPAPLHHISPLIPVHLSEIITTLLSKRPEERYQSTSQLLADLKFCLSQMKSTGAFPEIIHRKLKRIRPGVSQGKIYGRKREMTLLLETWRGVDAGGCGFVHIEGEAGLGKTALVHAVGCRIRDEGGRFMTGKFEQFAWNQPYTAIIQPFREIIRQLLAQADGQLEWWKHRIKQGLGENVGILSGLVPEIELIVGRQQNISRLEPPESINRFRLAFTEFVRLFCKERQPLVLFIDDLHWADSASMELLKVLTHHTSLPYFMLVTAARQEEITSWQRRCIEDMCRGECQSLGNIMTLAPLDNDSMASIAEYLLDTPLPGLRNVLQLLLDYSRGNPFHLSQFIYLLYERGILVWSHDDSCWELELSCSEETGETGRDVPGLLAVRLGALPEYCRRLLSQAACLGIRYKIRHLAMISGLSSHEIEQQLKPALSQGILRTDGQYYSFLHDKIQQAAYYLIDEDERPAMHLHVAQRLNTRTPESGKEDILFLLADQFNLGAVLLQDTEEKIELVKLNLQAGLQAAKSAAFESAFTYFNAGVNLIPTDGWETCYALALSIHEEFAEAACQCAEYDAMEHSCSQILENGKTILDKIRAYEVSIQAAYTRDKHILAVNIAIKVLSELGVRFPRRPRRVHAIWGLVKSRLQMAGRPIRKLGDLPAMTDPRALAIMKIISITGSAVYTARPRLMPLFIIKAVEISIQYGNAPQSPFIYATFGLLLCGVANDIHHGHEFGELALALLDHRAAAAHSKTVYVVIAFIMHWQRHLKEALPLLRQGCRAGLASGDFEFASWNLTQYAYYLFFTGENLDKVLEVFSRCRQEHFFLEKAPMLRLINLFFQTGTKFKAQDGPPSFSINNDFREQVIFNEKDQAFMANMYLQKLIFHCFFLQKAEAIASSKSVKQYIGSLIGQFLLPLYFFYSSLAIMANYRNSSWSERMKKLLQVGAMQRKMKIWARYAPMNHMHRWHLVEAEIAKSRKRTEKALYHYNEAIRHAGKNGFCHEEGLACELAALFCLDLDDNEGAKDFLASAWKCYDKWGADAKLRFMEQRYGDLLSEIKPRVAEETESRSLDMLTVMKASQAMSSEIEPERLPAKIMQILFTCSGAQRGVLLLKDKDGRLVVKGEISEQGFVTADQLEDAQDYGGSRNLPFTIITYALRTEETVLVEDAISSGIFSHDSYINNNRIRSACCLPLKYHGEVLGMIYLENNLMDRAFSRSQKEMLQLLAAQAAISFQNARLFHDMKAVNRKLLKENSTRIQVERKLRKQEEHYRLLAENVTDVIWTMDLDLNFTYVSPSVYRLRGFTPEEAIKQRLEDVMVPRCLSEVKEIIDTELALAKRGELDASHVVSLDLELLRKDGSTVWVESRITFLRDASGSVNGIAGVSRDISKRKQAEQELAASQQELRDLSRHMQEQWEEEMAVVARDIHDELGQSLTALNMDIAWLSERYSTDPDGIGDKIVSMQNVVKETIHSVKRISTGLRPSVLDHFGLYAAVEWYVGEFTVRTGLKSRVNIPDEEISLDKMRAIAMFRILQEALTNINRHANATEVAVTLERQHDRLLLSIRDNGCGFDANHDKKITSFGLVSMKERIQAHGGKLQVISSPGQGTTIKAILPV